MSYSTEETFDDAPYSTVIFDPDGQEIEVKGDAAGTYTVDGADLPPLYESGSGGVMLEPAEESFPTDIVVTDLTEATAHYRQSQTEVELNDQQKNTVIEKLNQDENFKEDFYTRWQESRY